MNNYYQNTNKFFYNLFEYLLAFCIILNCRSMYLSYYDIGANLKKVVFYGVVISVLCYALFIGKWNKKRFVNGIYFLIIIFVYLTSYILYTKFNFHSFIYLESSVVILIIYSSICKKNNELPGVFDKYINLLVVIAIISLIFWLFGSVLGIIKPTGVIYTTWTGTEKVKAVNSYFQIYFEPQIHSSINLVRNSSIFTESPMASFNFSLALMIDILLKKNSINKKNIWLFLGVITSFSTTGYFICISLIIYLFFRTKPKEKIVHLLKVMVIPMILFSGALAFYILYNKKMTVTNSGRIRLDDFFAGYNAWKRHMIFGNGYGNDQIIKQYMSRWRMYNVGFSNAITQVLAHGGIYLTLLYLVGFIGALAKSILKKQYDILAFLMLFIFMFSITIVTYQYVVILVLIYFYCILLKKS